MCRVDDLSRNISTILLRSTEDNRGQQQQYRRLPGAENVLRLTEASAKLRNGPPIDEKADYGLAVWAGEIPISLLLGAPIADPRLRPDIAMPAYLQVGGRGMEKR
jgi:hypothetical protein